MPSSALVPPGASASRAPASELHARDLLVSGHDLVAYLHHQLETEVGLLHSDQGAMHIGATAVEHARDLGFGGALQMLHVVESAMQNFGKSGRPILRRGAGS